MVIHVRIDDRLLHGQVVYGVLPAVQPALVIVADDHAAVDEWERETYLATAPEEVEVRVCALAPCARLVTEGKGDPSSVLILVRGPRELLDLVELGVPVTEAVVGGLHAGEGRETFAPDLQIAPPEARAFATLTDSGVRCYYQPLPTDEPSELPDLGRLLGGECGA